MEAQTIIETTVSSIAIRAGQLNLFTGEPEAGALNESVPDLQGWLFDPDWNLVLPDNVAGREIFIDEGVALTFPLRQSDVIREPRSRGLLAVPEPPAVSKTADSAQVIISG